MEIFYILTTLGAGSFIGIVVKHFLDKSKEKEERIFSAKRESFIKAIGIISGFADRTAHFLLTNIINHKTIDSIKLVKYKSELSEGLAPAILCASEELGRKLRKFNNLTMDLSELIEKLLLVAKKNKDGDYFINGDEQSPKELIDLKQKLHDFEIELIRDLKKELGF
ncbi:hypothetical protein K8Q98_00690 [Candidatus Nomurabacteria bacterium]|nr:hypothetical protein [Candidatus Nomurabacteria bacterium]